MTAAVPTWAQPNDAPRSAVPADGRRASPGGNSVTRVSKLLLTPRHLPEQDRDARILGRQQQTGEGSNEPRERKAGKSRRGLSARSGKGRAAGTQTHGMFLHLGFKAAGAKADQQILKYSPRGRRAALESSKHGASTGRRLLLRAHGGSRGAGRG